MHSIEDAKLITGKSSPEEVAKEILDAFLSIEKPEESELDNIEKVNRLDEAKL